MTSVSGYACIRPCMASPSLGTASYRSQPRDRHHRTYPRPSPPTTSSPSPTRRSTASSPAPSPRSRSSRCSSSRGRCGPTLLALERPDRVRDHVRRSPGSASRSASTAYFTHRASRPARRVRGDAGDPRLGGDRGPGHLLGRRPPQAPRVLRPRGRSAQPARRPRPRLERRAARPAARARRLAVHPHAARQPRALRAATCSRTR